MSRTSQPIERVSANDATTLATDRGPAPMNIGAVLVIEGGGALDYGLVRQRSRLDCLECGASDSVWCVPRSAVAGPCGSMSWTST